MENSYILYTHKLKGEYAETFKEIEFYCDTAGIDDDSKEERLSELLDMFINAQQSGKSVKKIVGSDIAWFCKEFCSDIDLKSKLKVLARTIKSLAWFVFIFAGLDIITIITDIVNGDDASLFTSNNTDISKYGFALMVMEVFAFLFNMAIIAIIHRFKKVPTKKQRIGFYILSGVLAIAGYALAIIFMPPVKFPTFITFVLCAVYLAVYYKFIVNKDRPKVSIFDRDENTQADFNCTTINEFHKDNEKLIKKGKAPKTPEEFIAKYRKMIQPSKWSKLSYLAYPLITAIACLLGDFDTPVDMVVFILVVSVIEILIARFFYKIEKTMDANIKSFIEAWEKDPTILDKRDSDSEDDDEYDDDDYDYDYDEENVYDDIEDDDD
ncbi:MAG: DUF1048 domain-containing protein [Acutalibacteraceae bacterium]|nr:DUF1048 domain-containing protein [Acutalibacteraceae bacterium]